MAKAILGVPQVQNFLDTVSELLKTDDGWEINNKPWAGGKVNKTRAYMAETGIGPDVVKEVVEELRVRHYSSTEDDYNRNFKQEQVWKFGITKNLVDKDEKLYIKLKVRQFEDGDYLLIMSFHPQCPGDQQDELQFPYAGYTD